MRNSIACFAKKRELIISKDFDAKYMYMDVSQYGSDWWDKSLRRKSVFIIPAGMPLGALKMTETYVRRREPYGAVRQESSIYSV